MTDQIFQSAFVNLTHAMRGSITANWRAVLLDKRGNQFLVTFVLATDSTDDRDEIEDVIFELEALEPDSEISVSVTVSDLPLNTFKADFTVYAR